MEDNLPRYLKAGENKSKFSLGESRQTGKQQDDRQFVTHEHFVLSKDLIKYELLP